MANPADVTARPAGLAGSSDAVLIAQVNKLTATVRALTAKLDADAGVTDANYAALLTDLGVTNAPSTITRTGF